MVKPFRITVRVKNNRMVKLREELGLSITEFSKKVGITAGYVCALENFKKSPWSDRGWSPSALKIAEFHGVSPEYIWPEEISAVKKTAFMLEAAAEDVKRFKAPYEELEHRELKGLLEEKVLPGLWLNEKRILQRRAEGETSTEIAADLAISRGYALQLEGRARSRARRVLRETESPLERHRKEVEKLQCALQSARDCKSKTMEDYYLEKLRCALAVLQYKEKNFMAARKASTLEKT
jgi:transcriptional regulator with XRE-family HTH domain